MLECKNESIYMREEWIKMADVTKKLKFFSGMIECTIGFVECSV
jgi:hypothetical protein